MARAQSVVWSFASRVPPLHPSTRQRQSPSAPPSRAGTSVAPNQPDNRVKLACTLIPSKAPPTPMTDSTTRSMPERLVPTHAGAIGRPVEPPGDADRTTCRREPAASLGLLLEATQVPARKRFEPGPRGPGKPGPQPGRKLQSPLSRRHERLKEKGGTLCGPRWLSGAFLNTGSSRALPSAA